MYTFRFKNKLNFGKKKNLLVFAFVLSLFILTTPLQSTAIYDLSADTPIEYDVTYSSIDDSLRENYFSINAGPFPDNKPLRVAVYDEGNTTAPTYTVPNTGNVKNNVSGMVDILSMSDHITAIPLTTAQIDSHQLTTASYDVFVLIDNHPRESVVNDILDFWLAGGGILCLDGSALFLNYFGVLPPEAIGTTGSGTYWNYAFTDMNITTRHPISKDYNLATEIELTTDYFGWDWAALQGSVIAPDLTMVANAPTDANDVSVLAFDPSDRGGKIATIAYDLVTSSLPELYQMIRDSCDWLAPKPKAKIAFDYSHLPRRTIDPWDTITLYPDSYKEMRNKLVSLDFTVDKIYDPIFGDAFTLSNLQQYDMLIIVSPDSDYTANERIAIETWVEDGGSLFVMGDNHIATFIDPNLRINQLLSPFGLSMWETSAGITATLTNDHKLPMTSNCELGLSINYAGYVNFTGDAFPIWQNGPDADFAAAGTVFGEGRVILMSDINWCEDGASIAAADNMEFMKNAVEWLTAATARVLVYSDWNAAGDYYNNPVSLALNDLGIKYYLTTPSFVGHDFDQFNMSLDMYEYDCVIIGNPIYSGIGDLTTELLDFANSGGKLIISTYRTDDIGTDPLFEFCGFEYNQDVTAQPPVYIWENEHDIFNQPINYGAANFTVFTPKADDGDTLNVLPHGIALAGNASTPITGGAYIVLREDEQTLYNAYLIDEFTGDLDDSTYADNFELWKNEIAFMLRPKLEFTPDFATKVKEGDVLLANLDITNFGLSRARAGIVNFGLPAELGTTVDPLEQPYSVAVGGTTTKTWVLDITGTGTYTLTFEALYQGFIGTVYGIFTVTIDVKSTIDFFSPPTLWYVIGIAGGVVALIIIIIIIAAVAKKKKKVSTR